ncbi:hypothetical protein [Gimesia sp.]|uniref:hypothetical protein n=1 Tax=Gimesia sp. TaxID=2024833 RepID=UPI0011885796|nr:tRNA_anti-like protein [Gimesia maris]
MLFFYRKLYSCLLFTALVSLAGCSSENDANPPGDGVAQSESKTSPESDDSQTESDEVTTEPSAAEPDFTLAATTLAREYESDKPATTKKYAGKLLRLTGKVNSFHRTLSGSGLMFLDGLSTGSKSGRVKLDMHELDRNPWANATIGQEVIVQGRFPENFSIGPELEECRFIEVTGDVKPEWIPAEQLAKTLSTDAQQTDEKYEGESIYLSGTVKKLDLENSRIELGTDQKPSAVLWSEFTNDFAHLKPGQEIKVLGDYVTDRSENQIPELNEIMLVAPQWPDGDLEPTKMYGNVPHFTPDRLVEAYRSNPRQFIYRYRNLDKPRKKDLTLADLYAEPKNELQIEGVIEKAVKEEGGWSVYFKNSQNHEIICGFLWPTSQEVEVLKPGYKVIVRGGLTQLLDSSPDEAIVLMVCKVIPQW